MFVIKHKAFNLFLTCKDLLAPKWSLDMDDVVKFLSEDSAYIYMGINDIGFGEVISLENATHQYELHKAHNEV